LGQVRSSDAQAHARGRDSNQQRQES
jgi:hypothetical protein